MDQHCYDCTQPATHVDLSNGMPYCVTCVIANYPPSIDIHTSVEGEDAIVRTVPRMTNYYVLTDQGLGGGAHGRLSDAVRTMRAERSYLPVWAGRDGYPQMVIGVVGIDCATGHRLLVAV